VILGLDALWLLSGLVHGVNLVGREFGSNHDQSFWYKISGRTLAPPVYDKIRIGRDLAPYPNKSAYVLATALPAYFRTMHQRK